MRIQFRTAARVASLRRQIEALDARARAIRASLDALDAAAAVLVEHALRGLNPRREAVAASLRDLDDRRRALSHEVAALRSRTTTGN